MGQADINNLSAQRLQVFDRGIDSFFDLRINAFDHVFFRQAETNAAQVGSEGGGIIRDRFIQGG